MGRVIDVTKRGRRSKRRQIDFVFIGYSRRNPYHPPQRKYVNENIQKITNKSMNVLSICLFYIFTKIDSKTFTLFRDIFA